MRPVAASVLLRRGLAMLLLTSLAIALVAMYTMHVGDGAHRSSPKGSMTMAAAPEQPIAGPGAMVAPASETGHEAQRLEAGAPEATCAAFEVLCVLPVPPASQPPAVQTTAAMLAVAALALLPALRRSTAAGAAAAVTARPFDQSHVTGRTPTPPAGLRTPPTHVPETEAPLMSKTRTTFVLIAVLGTAVTLSGCASAAGSSGMEGMDHSSGSMSPAATPSASAAAAFSDVDVMFAQMMIPHHAQAIEMADMLLAKDGVNADVVALAERIKAAQSPEIDQMNQLLASYGKPEVDPTSTEMPGMDHDMGSMGMDGMMTEEDMAALEDATGDKAASLFLTQMVEHHSSAVTMAEGEVAAGKDPAAVALAEKIIADQKAEIIEMKDLTKQL